MRAVVWSGWWIIFVQRFRTVYFFGRRILQKDYYRTPCTTQLPFNMQMKIDQLSEWKIVYRSWEWSPPSPPWTVYADLIYVGQRVQQLALQHVRLEVSACKPWEIESTLCQAVPSKTICVGTPLPHPLTFSPFNLVFCLKLINFTLIFNCHNSRRLSWFCMSFSFNV